MHIDVAAAQSGVSRFGERYHDVAQRWQYSKDETRPLDASPYSHLLTESPQLFDAEFVVVDSVLGFSSLDTACLVTLARRIATLKLTLDNDLRCLSSNFAAGETQRSAWLPFVRLKPMVYLMERKRTA